MSWSCFCFRHQLDVTQDISPVIYSRHSFHHGGASTNIGLLEQAAYKSEQIAAVLRTTFREMLSVHLLVCSA
jgi:hypothetical protein